MPSTPAALPQIFQQACALHQVGRFAEAERHYRDILATDAHHADSLHLLGVLAHQTNRPQLALNLISQAIGLRADVAAYHSNLGTVFKGLGRLDDAVAACQRALHLKPDDLATHYNLGNIWRELGRWDAAAESYRYTVRLKPDLTEAWSNLGTTYGDLKQWDAAVAAYRQALCLKPGDADTQSGLGLAFHRKGRLDEAETVYRRALHLRPDTAAAHHNLGIILKAQGKFAAELACHAEALHRDSNDAEAHFNESQTRLLLGDFATGWPKYEWRWRGGVTTLKPRGFTVPLWEGEALAGRTIFLHAEQGLGDTLQFYRYVSSIAADAAVIVEVPPPLKTLFIGAASRVRVVAQGDPLPPFDVHCPLLSLPRIFNTTLESIPRPIPNLIIDSQRVNVWRERLPKSGLRIGIAWQGNPNHEDDRNRSASLQDFLPLAKLPGVHLICLQKQYGLEQLAHLPDSTTVTTLGQDYARGDFAETAAVMASLDLVITIDSAVAHLAGTLNRPVWVLLPAVPDWRWLLDRDDTPWYPSMRLFRQTAYGMWSDVFDRVAKELAALVSS